MNDKYSLKLELIWETAATFCTMPVNFIGNMLIDKFKHNSMPNNILQIKREREALEEYNRLGYKVHEDLQLIQKNLKDLNYEFNARTRNNKSLNQEYKKLKNQLIMYSTFQQPEEYITLQRENIRTNELSNILQELIGNYPNATFNESSTIEEINAAYKELEEHHQKTVDTALTLFPNLYIFLNHTEKEKSSISDSKLPALSI